MATALSRGSDTSTNPCIPSLSHVVCDPSIAMATNPAQEKHKQSSNPRRRGDVPARSHGRRSSDSCATTLAAYKRSELAPANVKRSESCTSPVTRSAENKGSVRKTAAGTIISGYGNSQFYAKTGILPIMDTSERLENRHSAIRRVSRLHECGIRFPKLEECAHFHYDHVELTSLQVRICDEKQDVVYHQGNPDDVDHCFIVRVTSGDRSWLIRRTYDNMRLLDRQLHKCIYDRKYSMLPELKSADKVFENGISPLQKMLSLYLGRLSAIAGDMINCGPILSWFEMDNRGNRLIVTDESAINTPAIAAAHVIRRYQSMAADEVSFEVGDIVSVIDMPPPEDTIWWRGKRGFEVGYFPSECVEVIGDKVPQSMESRIPALKPVLRKRGKLISFLRTFFSTRPTRNTLKRSGIVKERVFGCDLGEHLLNSGHDVPLVLKTCADVIETHGIVDGIYRLSGVASNIQRLRNEFDEDKVPDLTSEDSLHDVHSVSSLLKMYFRELPNPLLTYQLYDKFAAAVQEDEENRLMRIHDVIQQLPPPHYRTTEYLINHLARVASHGKDTGMHCKNLAIVWAPNLLRSKELETACSAAALQGVGIQAVVTEFLIKYADLIFSDKLPTFLSSADAGTPRKARPKSLAISTPTKLLSLEEARERAMTSAATSQKAQKYIEVGGGPSNLPATYHTIIDHPHKKKGRKLNRSPAVGWKSFFTRKESNAKVKAKMAELRLSKTEKALTEDDVAQRRRLRSAKSADSLLASARTSMVGNRMSNASDGTTIINPYADSADGYLGSRVSSDDLSATVFSNSARRGSLQSDSDFEMEDLSPLDENFFIMDSLIIDANESNTSQCKNQLMTELQGHLQGHPLEGAARGGIWSSPTKRRHIQRSQSAEAPLRSFTRSRSFQSSELPENLTSVKLGRSPSWGPGHHGNNSRSGLHLQATVTPTQSSTSPAHSKRGRDGGRRSSRSPGSRSPATSLSPAASPYRDPPVSSNRLAASYSPTRIKHMLEGAADRQAISLSPTHLKALLNSSGCEASCSPHSDTRSLSSHSPSHHSECEADALRTGHPDLDQTAWEIAQQQKADVYPYESADDLLELIGEDQRHLGSDADDSDTPVLGEMKTLNLKSSPGATRKLVSRLSQDDDSSGDADTDASSHDGSGDEDDPVNRRWTPDAGSQGFSTIWEDQHHVEDAGADAVMTRKFADLNTNDEDREEYKRGMSYPHSVRVPADIQRSVDNLDFLGSQSDFYGSYPVSEASQSLDSLLDDRLTDAGDSYHDHQREPGCEPEITEVALVCGEADEDSDHASCSALLGSQHSISTQSSCVCSDVSETCNVWPPADLHHQHTAARYYHDDGGNDGQYDEKADDQCQHTAARYYHNDDRNDEEYVDDERNHDAYDEEEEDEGNADILRHTAERYYGNDPANHKEYDNDENTDEQRHYTAAQYYRNNEMNYEEYDDEEERNADIAHHTAAQFYRSHERNHAEYGDDQENTDAHTDRANHDIEENTHADYMNEREVLVTGEGFGHYEDDGQASTLSDQSAATSPRDDRAASPGRIEEDSDSDQQGEPLSDCQLQGIQAGDYFGLGSAGHRAGSTGEVNARQEEPLTADYDQQYYEDSAESSSHRRPPHHHQHHHHQLQQLQDAYGDEDASDSDGSVELPDPGVILDMYSHHSRTDDVTADNDDITRTRTQTHDTMAEVDDLRSAADIVDLAGDFAHGGYIPRAGLDFEDRLDPDPEEMVATPGSMDDFSSGYLPHRDFNEGWREDDEEDVDLFGDDPDSESQGDEVRGQAEYSAAVEVSQDRPVTESSASMPYERLQPEPGRIVIRRANTCTAQKVAVVQPCRQIAMTALPPGGAPTLPDRPPTKPGPARQQQYKRPDTAACRPAHLPAWSTHQGAPPQVVRSPVEESSSDSSETDDMTASAGSLDVCLAAGRVRSGRPHAACQDEYKPDRRQFAVHTTSGGDLQTQQGRSKYSSSRESRHQRSPLSASDVRGHNLSWSDTRSPEGENLTDDMYCAMEDLNQQRSEIVTDDRKMPTSESTMSPSHSVTPEDSKTDMTYGESECASQKHTRHSVMKTNHDADLKLNSPNTACDAETASSETSSPSRVQRKPSIKQLMSRFEGQACEEEGGARSGSSESESRVRAPPPPLVFQKPRILRLHSLSPTATDAPTSFGSSDSDHAAVHFSDRSSHGSKESLSSDVRRSSDAWSHSSKESLNTDQTKAEKSKLLIAPKEDGKSSGVSQLKSRFESSERNTMPPPVKPRPSKRRSHSDRPKNLDLFSAWESRSSTDKSPSSEREVFSDVSASEDLPRMLHTQGAPPRGGRDQRRHPYHHARSPADSDVSPTWTSIV